MAFRILLVEDDPVSREVVGSMLSSRGYIVETAEDGFSALRMAQEQLYDLVFIDYHLPEMDGYALARLMRSLGEARHRPLNMVAITADQFGLAARRSVDTVFDRVVSKPIDPDALFGIVADVLAASTTLEDFDAFFAPTPAVMDTTTGEAPSAVALWRARGLDTMPAAFVLPEPTRVERANLETCFRLVDAPAEADCLILLAPTGLPAVERLRHESLDFLKPLFTLDATLSEVADATFDPADGASWDATSRILAGFAARRRQLAGAPIGETSIDFRLAAYLFAADRSLELGRGASGEMIARYTAGFGLATIAASAKSLVAAGLMIAELKLSDEGKPRGLTLSLAPVALAKLSLRADKRSILRRP